MKRRTNELILFLLVTCVFLAGSGKAGAEDQATELPELRKNRAATFKITATNTHGSGVVISEEGHLLTAAHVVPNKKLDRITLEANGRTRILDASVVAYDIINDIAVIKVNGRFTETVVLDDSENIMLGNSVYNIGYPYSMGETVGRGYIMQSVIGAVTDENGFRLADRIVLDIPDGPGTSGSAMFSAQTGRLAGIMKRMYNAARKGEPPWMVRVATPVNKIRALLDRHNIPYKTADKKTKRVQK